MPPFLIWLSLTLARVGKDIYPFVWILAAPGGVTPMRHLLANTHKKEPGRRDRDEGNVTYCFITSYYLFSCVASEPYMICFHGSAEKPQRKTGTLNAPGNHRHKSTVYR